MSQVTRCPACGTRFKVVADQLRISQGWVRCGVCHEIFDATQDLMPMPPQYAAAPSSSRSTSVPSPGPARAPAATQAAAGVPAAGVPAADASAPDASAPGASAPGFPAPGHHPPPDELDFDTLMSRFVGDEADTPVPPPPHPVPAVPESQTETAPAVPTPVPVPAPESEPQEAESLAPRPAAPAQAQAGAAEPPAMQDKDSSQPAPEFSSWPESGSDAAALPEAEPGFVRQARRKAFWRQPAVRGLLLIGSLGGVAALAGQVMWQQRDALAVEHPALAPALQALCSMADCEIQPRRQIADVVIASSGFRQAQRSGQYQWSLSLENRSELPVAMPAVELTLTDAQDKPLLRRVIRLDQLGAPAQMPARGEWSVTAPVEVQDLGAVVAGYRALVFYP